MLCLLYLFALIFKLQINILHLWLSRYEVFWDDQFLTFVICVHCFSYLRGEEESGGRVSYLIFWEGQQTTLMERKNQFDGEKIKKVIATVFLRDLPCRWDMPSQRWSSSSSSSHITNSSFLQLTTYLKKLKTHPCKLFIHQYQITIIITGWSKVTWRKRVTRDALTIYFNVDQDTCCQASHYALLKAQPRTGPQSPGDHIL